MGCCGDCCAVPSKESRDPLRHDPEFSGPVRSRSCTDVVWLLVFILFLGAWGYVGYYGIKHGNVEQLLAPMDMKGRRCGLDSTLQDKKYLVFFDISECLSPTTAISGCKTPQVCVNECPKDTIVFNTGSYTAATFSSWRSKMICVDGINTATMTHDEATQYMKDSKCASYVLKSQSVLGRCFINVTEAIEKIEAFINYSADDIVNNLTNLIRYKQLSSQIAQDLVQSRWYMLGALLAVVVLCFLYILILRWVVTPVVWVSIVGLLALLAFSCYLCYVQYVFYRSKSAGLYTTSYSLQGFFQTMFSKHQTWLALLIILGIILIIVLLIVIFLRSRITIAIALIREGSKAVIDIKSTVFFPIFPWIIQCGVLAYFATVLVYLLSIGDPEFKVVGLNETCDCGLFYKDQDTCNPSEFLEKCKQAGTKRACEDAICHFSGLVSPHEVNYMHFVNLLGCCWAMFFISGCADMILAGAFSKWYWTFDKRKVPFWTLTAAIYRTVCFHLGTVAFGALIIAIVRVIRIMLEYIDHKLKKFDNPFTRCILCFCKCCFWCLESFLKFINKNAYIMCAVHGKNFCTSARDAFSLLMRNIIRVVVLDKVTDFIFFLSKLLLSISVGFAVYYLMEWGLVYEVTQGQRLHSNYVPAILLGVATYLISTIFFNVYAMAVDTLFLCFLEDCERNDGSSEKKYLMSKDLMRILGKNNKKD
ncbi:choline transporter-like 2 isoform X3 [Cydia pomonella]|uniref:choline transporter-like 2 isoform X3 n=1 Tax=Cydia pomonella TaxID=82600 RepID=UPI002ADE318C|nr:choline transporter-like 2 isoform X3 [Cydia pomonella]